MVFIEITNTQNQKLAPLQRFLRILTAVPYTREFFLVGSVARGNFREESDIDIVTVAEPKRVWFNRILLVSVCALLGHRRTKKKRRDRFCFNASVAADKNLVAGLPDLYPDIKRIDLVGTRTLRTRSTIEFVLEALCLAPLFESISRRFLGRYIRSSFANLRNDPATICILEQDRIIYHPPQKKLSL